MQQGSDYLGSFQATTGVCFLSRIWLWWRCLTCWGPLLIPDFEQNNFLMFLSHPIMGFPWPFCFLFRIWIKSKLLFIPDFDSNWFFWVRWSQMESNATSTLLKSEIKSIPPKPCMGFIHSHGIILQNLWNGMEILNRRLNGILNASLIYDFCYLDGFQYYSNPFWHILSKKFLTLNFRKTQMGLSPHTNLLYLAYALTAGTMSSFLLTACLWFCGCWEDDIDEFDQKP